MGYLAAGAYLALFPLAIALFIYYIVLPQERRNKALRAAGLCTGCERPFQSILNDDLCGDCRVEMSTAP